MKDEFKPVGRKPVKTDVVETISLTTKIKDEPDFQPPEIMAAEEPVSKIEEMKGPGSKVTEKKWFQKLTKKQWILAGLAALIVVGAGGGATYALLHKKPAPKPVAKVVPKPEPPKPTTEALTLTGAQVPIGSNKIPVTGVMIENSPDARPQSGLNSAGVVIEAVAEGGITRFLALFQSDSIPDYLGPVRSARPYYLDYLSGFDAAIAHVGGSPDALAQIKSQNIKDLDQFFNSGAYKRVSSRYAPHNVYTSMANLAGLQKTKGFSSTFTGFPRKAEKAIATPTAKTIDFAISSFLYNAHYDYDGPSNTYKRSEGGKPHTDERSAAQLAPKTVIAIVVPKGIASDGTHTTYQNIGTGKAFIFQDGTQVEGVWTKSSAKAQITFTDAAGAAIPLDIGQTWISLVGQATDVSFKP